jgi:hypothetical protein
MGSMNELVESLIYQQEWLVNLRADNLTADQRWLKNF